MRYDNIRLLSYYQTIIDSINYQNISSLIGLDRAKVCYLDIPYHDTNRDMITSDYYHIIRLLLILSTIRIYQF